MEIDLKSIIIGLLLGIIIMFTMGLGGGGTNGIGFAVPADGKALVKGSNGEAFIVDVRTAMAERVLFKKPEPGDSRYPNNINGYALSLSD